MTKNKSTLARVKLNEFSATIDEIRDRSERGLVNFAFADVRKQLFSVPANQSGHGLPCEVAALSPSEGDIFSFVERVVESHSTRENNQEVYLVGRAQRSFHRHSDQDW